MRGVCGGARSRRSPNVHMACQGPGSQGQLQGRGQAIPPHPSPPPRVQGRRPFPRLASVLTPDLEAECSLFSPSRWAPACAPAVRAAGLKEGGPGAGALGRGQVADATGGGGAGQPRQLQATP